MTHLTKRRGSVTREDLNTDKLPRSMQVVWELSEGPKTITSVLFSFNVKKFWASQSLTSSKHSIQVYLYSAFYDTIYLYIVET